MVIGSRSVCGLYTVPLAAFLYTHYYYYYWMYDACCRHTLSSIRSTPLLPIAQCLCCAPFGLLRYKPLGWTARGVVMSFLDVIL